MLIPKYYEKLEQDQAAAKAQDNDAAFSLDLLAGKGLSHKVISYFFEHTRWPYWFLRQFLPVLRVGKIAIVTRYDDVKEILSAPQAFEVPFGREMTELVVGQNAVLGMNELTEHTATLDRIHDVFPAADVQSRIATLAEQCSRDLIEQSGGRIDVVKDLFALVPAKVCRTYYGLEVDDEDAFAEWTIAISTMLFGDPFGNPVTRHVGLAGGAMLRETIIRSIAKTHTDAAQGSGATGSPRDTIAARLVALQRNGGAALTDDVIRSILYGMVIGFVPTNTLAAGNIWQVLLERPEAMNYCSDAAGQGDDAALSRGLMEALRLRPPLNPGVFRYVREPHKIAAGFWRERTLPPETTVFVATASAMHDERRIEHPETFLPDRDTDNSLIFGHGLHWCIGASIAQSQLTQMFKVLLCQPHLRPAKGAAGKLIKVGPFPRSQTIEYGSSQAVPADSHRHSMVTVCIPVEEGVDRDALKKRIIALGNPAAPEVRAKFSNTGLVHFASMSLIVGRGKDVDNVVLEFSADGSKAAAIRAVAQHAGDALAPVFAAATPSNKMDPVTYLENFAVKVGPGPTKQSGLEFCGTPELSLERIRKEMQLEDLASRKIGEFLKRTAEQGRHPLEALREVREHLKQNGCEWALEPEPMPFVDTAQAPWMARDQTLWSLLVGHVRNAPLALLVPVVSAAILAVFIYKLIWPGAGAQVTMIAAALTIVIKVVVSAILSVLALASVLAAIAGIVAMLVRRKEKSDTAVDLDPDPVKVAAIMERENAVSNGVPLMQNHMTAVSQIKPGLLRALTLRLAFFIIGLAGKIVYRPGFLSDIGTIHFARWVHLPGTRNLMFLSNYDGSWESYLEDFITKASKGLTAIWSNTADYPRTRYLFFDGATDGDRFKRWARRQQIPTLFWYAAEPSLSTDRKRTNAMIRDGIARARTLSDAQAWLDLFASVPRPATALEFDEIQSLAFGGMGSLPRAACLVINFPASAEQQDCRKWLNGLIPASDPNVIYELQISDTIAGPVGAAPSRLSPAGERPAQRSISFGDRVPNDESRIVALSAQGIARLDAASAVRRRNGSDTLTSFPTAFVTGMADSTRARILGDVDSSDPLKWAWGGLNRTANGKPSPVHAVLLLYGRDEETLRALLTIERQALATAGLAEVTTISMQGLDKNPAKRTEPFGYLDGISQPLVRGTSAYHQRPSKTHAVAAGELILGYPDNRGFFPPSPQVLAKDDPNCCLSSPSAELPMRYPQYVTENRPRFAPRDLGRNGSYLVIRQLEQNVDAFAGYLDAEAKRLTQQGLNVPPEWIGAKLLGRWKDGSSLVRRPEPPPTPIDAAVGGGGDDDVTIMEGRRHWKRLRAENDFLLGVEDPQGLRCPYGSHIRRANPRDSFSPGSMDQLAISNRHRILRVGRPYVAPAEDGTAKPRGLLFMCINADIDRQFEFIQQTWISGRSFHGLRDEVDAITATGPGGREPTIAQPGGPVKLSPLKQFVKVVGGGYFFLPSRRALRYLSLPRDAHATILAARKTSAQVHPELVSG